MVNNRATDEYKNIAEVRSRMITKDNKMQVYVSKKYRNQIKEMKEYFLKYGIPLNDMVLFAMLNGYKNLKNVNYYERLKNKNWITMDHFNGSTPLNIENMDVKLDEYNPIPRINEYYYKGIEGKSITKALNKYKTIDKRTATDMVKSAVAILRQIHFDSPYLLNNALLEMESDSLKKQAKNNNRINKQLDSNMIALNVLRKSVYKKI